VIALRAMFGQDEANHGTTRYRVGPEGLVIVPPEVAEPLLKRGGFALAAVGPAPGDPVMPTPASASLALVALRHRTAGCCSFGGTQYCADKSGVVQVPAEAVPELAGHGFMPVEATTQVATATGTEIPSEDCGWPMAI
jgi:hypothetical protein